MFETADYTSLAGMAILYCRLMRAIDELEPEKQKFIKELISKIEKGDRK